MSNAREIEEQAAFWLMRREESDWSPSDQEEFDAWLEKALAHKASYWRLEHGWREADRIKSLGLRPIEAERAGLVGKFASHWKPIALAASLLVMVGIGAVQLAPWARSPVVAEAQYRTSVGERRTISLADGSKAELNTGTVVRTAIDDRRREVWLERGEAFFEVTRAEGRPFIVHAGNRTVTVLGTKFAVRRDGERVTVSVLEGRVRVDEASAGKADRAAIISAGDTAIVRGASTLVVARSEERVESALAWRDGMITFDQATLAEAAAEFNRYNRRPIIIADPEAAGIRIGGTFQASNADAFVRLLRDAYGMRVTEDEQAVRISS